MGKAIGRHRKAQIACLDTESLDEPARTRRGFKRWDQHKHFGRQIRFFALQGVVDADSAAIAWLG
jgi:hypothetical protein